MGIAAVQVAITVISTAMQMAAQAKAAKQAEQQAKYQEGIARNNQVLAQRAADDARLRGDEAASKTRTQADAIKGRQRAVMAANGVVIDQDTALDITTDTAGQGELDALTVRSNAEREALGYEAQGMNFQGEAALSAAKASNASSGAFGAMAGTFMSGASSVASKWYGYQNAGGASGGSGTGGGGFGG